MHDLHIAFTITVAVAAIGAVWEALELILERHGILAGMFDWPVVRSRYYILLGRPRTTQLSNALFSTRGMTALMCVQLFSALVVPVAVWRQSPVAVALALVVLSTHCLVHFRLLVGMDGADQMQTLIWAATAVYAAGPHRYLAWAAGIFLTAQLVLSYFTAGIAKAISPVWRGGSAISLIMRCSTYASPGVSRASQIAAVSVVGSWATIAFEVGSPFLVLLGGVGVAVFVGLALVFHMGIALTMGLTTFVWSFAATLPVAYVVLIHAAS